MERLNGSYPGIFGGRVSEDGEDNQGGSTGDGFNETYGWLYNAKRVADFEGIPLEDAMDLSVIQFLNDIGYLKSKDEYDKKLLKNAGITE